MRKLLVDMSHYPCLEFPQLNMGLTVEETRTATMFGRLHFLILLFLFQVKNYGGLTLTVNY